VQKYWTAERYIRVTDDDGLAQFIQINGTGQDPQTGRSVMVNALGSLDVDIILDEGPDTINAQADVYETLSQVLPAIANMLTPPQAQAAVKVLVDTSALPASAKKEFREASKPQPPDGDAGNARRQPKWRGSQGRTKPSPKTMLNMASAQEKGMPDGGAPAKPEKYELPPEIQNAQAVADINDTNASAVHKRAQAAHISTQSMLAPVELLHDTAHKIADRQQRDDHYTPAGAE
jgi:hypothetical protein